MLSGFEVKGAAVTYSGRNQGDILMYDREHSLMTLLNVLIFIPRHTMTSDTKKIINGDAAMKDSCILINISRAERDVTEFHGLFKVVSGLHWICSGAFRRRSSNLRMKFT